MAWATDELRIVTVIVTALCLLVPSTYAINIEFNACGATSTGLRVRAFGISVSDCLSYCDTWTNCSHLVYRRISKTCDLYMSNMDIGNTTCIGNALIRVRQLEGANESSVVELNNVTFCPEPETVENGVLLGNMREAGSRRVLVCQPPYTVLGTNQTTCNTSGQWSEMGICGITCTTPTADTNMIFQSANDAYREATNTMYTGAYIQNITFLENSTIEINCNNDTTLLGSPTLTCISGNWSTMGQCLQICDTPIATSDMTFLNINNGIPGALDSNYTTSELQNITFFENSSIAIHCTNGTALLGSLILMCASSQWSPMGQCLITCDTPTASSDMAFLNILTSGASATNYTQTELQNIAFFDNSSIEIHCINGAILVGSATLNCAAGQWSPMGQCLITCNTPTATSDMSFLNINNGIPGTLDSNYTTAELQSISFFENSSIEIHCINGATLVGSATLNCAAGQWSPMGQCLITCDTPTATSDMVFQNIIDGSPGAAAVNYTPAQLPNVVLYDTASIQIICTNGAVLIGSTSITCTVGYWTTLPACRRTTMRLSCTLNSECIDPNSECRDGQCWCQPELSHDPTSNACVSACAQYGNTFQVVLNTAIANEDFLCQSENSMTDCMNLCLTHQPAGYMCKHTDWNQGATMCCLSNDLTPLPGAISHPDWDYLLRDCA